MNTFLIIDIHPGLMMVIGILSILFIAWFFRPEKGGLAMMTKIKRNNQRIQLEDALKHLFDCEYRKASCSMSSIAGNLNVSVDAAGRLIERLLSLGLITVNEQSISLTDTGRSYALRVIRVHRVWESYLADETSVAQSEWHNEADRLEHEVSLEDTEKLAAQMGHPVFDPHGDPIPTAEGEFPAPKGKPLSSLGEGDIGRIIHMEDEPKSIYEQLVVEGLYPGMQVYVTDVTEKKITFAANGEECTLTPFFASHITIEALTKGAPIAQKQDLLSSLAIGQEAEIAGISPNCRGQQRRRLMDLGIVPGSLISVVMRSASGDPTGYRVMGTTIGIRKSQADQIFINKKQ